MGNVSYVSNNTFPKQGRHLNKKTRVYLGYTDTEEKTGTIIRDDIEHPYLTIIQLEDGRVVLGTECVYSPLG